jgi:hypothetical protein
VGAPVTPRAHWRFARASRTERLRLRLPIARNKFGVKLQIALPRQPGVGLETCRGAIAQLDGDRCPKHVIDDALRLRW